MYISYAGSILCTLAISWEWLSNFSIKISPQAGQRKQFLLVTLIVALSAAVNVTKFMEFEAVTQVGAESMQITTLSHGKVPL